MQHDDEFSHLTKAVAAADFAFIHIITMTGQKLININSGKVLVTDYIIGKTVYLRYVTCCSRLFARVASKIPNALNAAWLIFVMTLTVAVLVEFVV